MHTKAKRKSDEHIYDVIQKIFTRAASSCISASRVKALRSNPPSQLDRQFQNAYQKLKRNTRKTSHQPIPENLLPDPHQQDAFELSRVITATTSFFIETQSSQPILINSHLHKSPSLMLTIFYMQQTENTSDPFSFLNLGKMNVMYLLLETIHSHGFFKLLIYLEVFFNSTISLPYTIHTHTACARHNAGNYFHNLPHMDLQQKNSSFANFRRTKTLRQGRNVISSRKQTHIQIRLGLTYRITDNHSTEPSQQIASHHIRCQQTAPQR